MPGYFSMRKKLLPILWSTVRWGIAVFGILYVISKMSWHDQVYVPSLSQKPLSLLTQNAQDTDPTFTVLDPHPASRLRSRAMRSSPRQIIRSSKSA